MVVWLKTPEKGKLRFDMKVYKRVNGYRLTDKLVITLRCEDGVVESG